MLLMDFRFCYATYQIITFLWEYIFSNVFIFLEDHVQAFTTCVVRASNSSWARRSLLMSDEFRENPVSGSSGGHFWWYRIRSCSEYTRSTEVFAWVFSHIQRFQMDPVLFEDKPKNIYSAENYDLEPHTITKSISASIIFLELPLWSVWAESISSIANPSLHLNSEG